MNAAVMEGGLLFNPKGPGMTAFQKQKLHRSVLNSSYQGKPGGKFQLTLCGIKKNGKKSQKLKNMYK